MFQYRCIKTNSGKIMLKNIIALPLIAFILIACGGGGSGSDSGTDTQTATVGIIITDASSEDFDEAIATITSADLLCENGKQNLFTGSATFDLLRLTEFVELLTVTEGIQPDTCNKIRLQLDSLALNALNEDGSVDEENSHDATLVANGKIDLLVKPSFRILPGETLFVSLDFDVDKSLKITETGNGKFIVRPVIFVRVGDTPGFKRGLTRVFGIIDAIRDDAGAMRICMNELTALPVSAEIVNDLPRRCLPVILDNDNEGSDTGIFGQDGLPIQAGELAAGNPVTVVGLLAIAEDGEVPEPVLLESQSADDSDNDLHPKRPFILKAIVVERGRRGTFLRLGGMLNSGIDPVTDTYEILLAPGQGFGVDSVLTGQLFPQSRIIDPRGMDIDRTTLMFGDRTRIDGVLQLNNDQAGSDILRTALMIAHQDDPDVPPPGDDILIGKILGVDGQSFRIATDTGDRCVNAPDAVVLFLVENEGSLEVIKGDLDDLAENAVVIVYGAESDGGCFIADLVVSRSSPKPEPL